MAIFTIVSQPQSFSPVYNEMYYTLDSDLKVMKEFLIEASVYVKGEKAAMLRVPINPSGYGEFDIQRVVKQFTDSTFNPNIIVPTNVPSTIATYSVEYKLKFKKEWEFNDNFSLTTKVAFWGTDNPYLNIGDEIYIVQDPGSDYNEYNGIATVTEVGYEASGVWGSSGYYVRTNKNFIGSTPLNPGKLSISNFGSNTVIPTYTSNVNTGFYGRIDFENYIGMDFNDYKCSVASKGDLMTTVPNGYNVNTGDKMFINAYTEVTNQLKYMYIETNNGVFRIQNSNNNAGSDISHRMVQFPCGPHQIDTISSTVVSGTKPILRPSTATYSIYTADGSGVRTSEIKTFKYNQVNCNSYSVYQLIFLDKLGSFIPFDFTLKDTRNINITRKEFTQNLGGYVSSKGGYHYNTYDRGSKQLGNVWETSYKLRSDYMDDSTYTYLQELLYSNEVYMLSPDDGKIYSVIVSTGTYKLDRRSDGLLRFDIDINTSFKNYTQD